MKDSPLYSAERLLNVESPSSSGDMTYGSSTSDMLANLNEVLNGNVSSASSTEDANSCHTEAVTGHAHLDEDFLNTLLNHSKAAEPSALDNILANYGLARANICGDGNCFFRAIAHALRNMVIPDPLSDETSGHLDSLGLLSSSVDTCSQLRKLVVNEGLTHSNLYKPFLPGNQIFDDEAMLFLNVGHFASDLGNSMPLAMANVLKLPIVVISQMENLPVLPITPRETLQCFPIFIAFNHCGTGHYDAVIEAQKPEPTSEVCCPADKPNDSEKNKSECCRCGQSAKKKDKVITSCDKFRKRCRCFQGLRGCTKNCQCYGCENPHGKRQLSSKSLSTGTRKRRPAEMRGYKFNF